MAEQRFLATCPICEETKEFVAQDDYWHWRGTVQFDCHYGGCIPRQRAIAEVLFDRFTRDEVKQFAIHESSPTDVGLSRWLRLNCSGYVISGYFPDFDFGTSVNGIRNENLEKQTFPDNTFDLVLHLDVMEHLFDPFQALREIKRTLKPSGTCLFTAPTYPEREWSEQVAFNESQVIRIVGNPEYHGNPNDPEGALVTWRYGYDLPLKINRETGFDVEVRRWYSRSNAILGAMTEVYICTNYTTTC